MDPFYSQLNLNLYLDLNIEAFEKTEDFGTNKLYKLKVAKTFEHIIFAIFIYEVANGFYFVYSYICYQFLKRFL